MLKVEQLEVSYGDFQILWGPSLRVREKEIVCLLGPNGAGKSTILNSISGLVKPKNGAIHFTGERIDGMPPHKIVMKGLSHVLERRRVFPFLTVLENLKLGAYNPVAKPRRKEAMDWVFSLFPVLRDRSKQMANSLSGGEQQMLAIGRGLMSKPRLLLLDEPFLGLAPMMIKVILEMMQRINQESVAILFIEQNVQLALSVAHRGYLLESGRMVIEGPAQEILYHDEIRKVYLGV